jgi:hypothetical protein
MVSAPVSVRIRLQQVQEVFRVIVARIALVADTRLNAALVVVMCIANNTPAEERIVARSA